MTRSLKGFGCGCSTIDRSDRMIDRGALYCGVVYLTNRLNKQYPDNFHDYSMIELKMLVEELEKELLKELG